MDILGIVVRLYVEVSCVSACTNDENIAVVHGDCGCGRVRKGRGGKFFVSQESYYLPCLTDGMCCCGMYVVCVVRCGL